MAFVSTYPVNLSYNYGPNVGTVNSAYVTSEGMIYNISPMLSAAQDATFNQNSLNILSNSYFLSDSLSGADVVQPANYVISTTISVAINGTTYYFYISGSGYNTPVIGLTTQSASATVFNLKFNSDNTISISNNNLYLTTDSTTVLKLSAFNTGSGYSTHQSFYYNINNNNVALFNVLNGQIACINTSLLVNPKKLFLNAFTSFNDISNQLANVFSLDRYSTTLYKNLGTTSNVKYLGTTNNIAVVSATDNLPHNYLITAPYYNTDTTKNTLGYNITALKNNYSPEGIQTPTLSSVSRKYNKLFTGLNTESGNDKIYLSYRGNEVLKVFKKDTDTYFHYPANAAVLALNDSTLAYAGSVAGSSPYRSDRIFVKQADYGAYTPWGTPPGSTLKGTYFCSWLWDSPTGPVWMDRYFDPTRVNTTSVIDSPGTAGSSDNNYPNVIWDVTSTKTFNPLSLYVYHKIGDNDNLSIVNMLSGSLTHYISKWTSPLIDSVTNNVAGIIYNYNSSSVNVLKNSRYPILNTSTCWANLALNDKDLYTPGFTLAFQAFNNDWSNIRGDQIIGNFYNGGFGLFKNNPLLTPFVSIVNSYSNLNTYNTTIDSLNVVNTSISFSGKTHILKGKHTETYFIVDSTKTIYEFDQDGVLLNVYPTTGTVVNAIYFTAGVTYTITSLGTTNFTLIGAASNTVGLQFTATGAGTGTGTATIVTSLIGAHLINESGTRKIVLVTKYNSNNIIWYKYLTNGTLDQTNGSTVGGGATGANSYAIDLKPVTGTTGISYYNSVSSCVVDSNNIIWALSADTVTKGINTDEPKYILSAYQPERIAVDHLNNIWMLYGGVSSNNLCKMDNYGRIAWDISLTNIPPASGCANYVRTINFTAELNPTTGKTDYYGLILNGINQTIAKVEPLSGLFVDYGSKLLSSTNTSQGLNIVYGDTTGYDYQRKYIYPSIKQGNLKLTGLFSVINGSLSNSNTVEYIYDATQLTPGWHHFAITVDSINNMYLWIDGVSAVGGSVGNVSDIYRVYNKRNNPNLMIGTSTFKTEDLATYTKAQWQTYSFNGGIADVRFYDQALQRSDIKAIQRSFNTNSFDDLTWSLPTGSRYYIEQIDRFFPHRMPGAKSQLFNVRIKNSNITNPELRNIIEQNIIASLSKTTPVHTNLNNIIWE